MLKFKFRNAIITAPNHKDLHDRTTYQALANIDKVFDKTERFLKQNPPKELCYCVTRINKTDKLLVAYIPSAINNPYVLFFENNRTLSKEIPLDKIRLLANENLAAYLESNIKRIDSNAFKMIQNPTITDTLQHMYLRR